MPLKETNKLYFYDQAFCDNQLRSGRYFIGIFSSARHDKVVAHTSSNWLRRMLQAPLEPLNACDDVSFVAAAYIEQRRLARIGYSVIHVCNIAAEDGYGPTMYAALIQLAQYLQLDGVVPTQKATDILPKPKKIWHRFACEYGQQITLTPTQEMVHQDAWLNNVYALVDGAQLLDFSCMQSRFSAYMGDLRDDPYGERVLAEKARTLASKSVTAHHNAREEHRRSSGDLTP